MKAQRKRRGLGRATGGAICFDIRPDWNQDLLAKNKPWGVSHTTLLGLLRLFLFYNWKLVVVASTREEHSLPFTGETAKFRRLGGRRRRRRRYAMHGFVSSNDDAIGLKIETK
jgi:hypothetical protein